MTRREHDPALVLAFDTGSPTTSVAVARGGVVLAETSLVRDLSSPSVVADIDTVMASIGASPSELGTICVLRGPGSFTGLRIGLATALGLHHALGVRVAAMPTLRVLAEASAASERVMAVVDALRAEWFVQTFRRSAAGFEDEGPPLLTGAAALAGTATSCDLIGFGAARLAAAAALDPSRAIEPPPLAGVAARLAASWQVWDVALLTEPLYLRPAPTTPAPARPRFPSVT